MAGKKSMYHNELKHELERNLKIIKERDNVFRDIARHTRNDEGKKQTIIDVLNRDIEHLNNSNEEHLNKGYEYKEKIKKLKDNLSNEEKVRKKLEKIYKDLKNDNEDLLLEFDGVKTINEILKKDNHKHKQKIEELEKELEISEEYINTDVKIKDKAQKHINELTILKDMHEKEIENLKDIHEKEIENLKDTINDKDTSINELKNQLILKEKSDQEPKSRKRADQEPKSRKRADQEPKSRKRANHQGKGYVNLPILLSKLNINSSKELISNIKQLINNLYDNEQITKQVYNNLIKAITNL